MIYRGKVQNGVVILQEGAALPDGTDVSVTPCTAPAPSSGPETKLSVWEKLVQLGRKTESQPSELLSDLAANHDHYLHGLPKRK